MRVVYRIAPQEAQKEENGRREQRARPGVTYILLSAQPRMYLRAADTDSKATIVRTRPKEAKRVSVDFNRNGAVPTWICNLIELQECALRELRALQQKKTS